MSDKPSEVPKKGAKFITYRNIKDEWFYIFVCDLGHIEMYGGPFPTVKRLNEVIQMVKDSGILDAKTVH